MMYFVIVAYIIFFRLATICQMTLLLLWQCIEYHHPSNSYMFFWGNLGLIQTDPMHCSAILYPPHSYLFINIWDTFTSIFSLWQLQIASVFRTATASLFSLAFPGPTCSLAYALCRQINNLSLIYPMQKKKKVHVVCICILHKV